MEFLSKVIRGIRNGKMQEFIGEILWIFRFSVRYRWQILWYIVVGILSTGMGLGSSVVSKYMIDTVTGYHSSQLALAASLYIGMRVAQILANMLTDYISAGISIHVEQEIRANVFARIMQADWQALAEYHSGDILNRVNSDVSTVSSSVLSLVPDVITRSVQFLGALCIILYYDPPLAVLSLLSAPVTILVSKTLMRNMRRFNKKLRESSSRMMSFHEESFQNIQFIKSFGLTRQYGERLDEVQKEYRDCTMEYKRFSIKTAAMMSFTGMAVSSLCFGWGIYRLWTGRITYGTMTLFLQMSSTLASAFSLLINLVPGAISAATSAGRIMELTELPKENAAEEQRAAQLAAAAQTDGIELDVDHIDFSYDNSRLILHQACLRVQSGEVIALVGPSGEGKTTMLRILLGLVNVQAGALRARAGAEDMSLSASTRCLFSYVPQGNTMFSGTVADNLRMVKPDATDEQLIAVLRDACAYEFIEKLPDGIYSKVKERGGGFSEGQAQRLAIARALLSPAPVMLLDEATSALDVATERRVLRNIMHSEQNKACVVTTHRPSVLGICTRIYRISDRQVTLANQQEVDAWIQDF